jgi:uncharacterized membrane protein
LDSPLESPQRTNVARAGWSLVWFGTLVAALGAWAFWSTWPVLALFGPLAALVAIGAIAVVWMGDLVRRSWFQWVSLGVALLVALLSQGAIIASHASYSTDSAAFNQIAAMRLLRGINPYLGSMMPEAARLLHDPGNFWTYTLGGGHVSSASYPAGSFLFQVPLRVLGFHHLSTDVLDLLGGLAACLLLFVMLPKAIRWLAPTLLLGGSFLGIFANGGTDGLLLPFLLLAVWRWDRFAEGSAAGAAGWLSPLALGLACSVKQTAWFCVPFLVIGVGLEAYRRRSSVLRPTLAYLGAAAGAFALINLPFIIWSPAAWWRGVTLPISQPLVPDGQGLVTLGLHGITRSVHLGALDLAGMLAGVALLVGFVLWYQHLKPVWLFLLPFVLFVPGRSLFEYLVDLLPAALVAATSVERVTAPVVSLRPALRRALLAIPAAGVALFVVLGLTSPVLGVQVDSVATTYGTRLYRSMDLTLANNTSTRVTPHVMVLENNTHPNGFWHLAGYRPLVLAPHQTRQVTLFPPGITWTSLRDQYWIVAAYAADPASVSTSVPMRWNHGQR